jgi:SAM-dependent methyltransferase
MHRTLHPELLDSLPPDHPDALHNRRDLRRINAILGNHRWFARMLPAVLRPGERVLELGAGTGELGLRLARGGMAVDGLDLWPRPACWESSARWHRADLRAFDGFGAYAALIGNLIFHQLSDADLLDLGQRLRSHARVIAAVEPARRRISQRLYAILARALGANHVSLHDGHVSIQAGFRGSELPQLLGLSPAEWEIRGHTTLLGVYRIMAVRRA